MGDGQLVERDMALVALLAAAGGEHDRGTKFVFRHLLPTATTEGLDRHEGRERVRKGHRNDNAGKVAATMTGATHEGSPTSYPRRLATRGG